MNSAVFLDLEYLPENPLNLAAQTPLIILNAGEDLIPLDEAIALQGPCCYYLEQEIISPEARELWAVIGNNDGFKLWVNGELAYAQDEIRYWTPFNNSELIKLNKGSNIISLKLLRRTANLHFSLGLRKGEGKHWNRREWFADIASVIR
jgi:hypothetical protein